MTEDEDPVEDDDYWKQLAEEEEERKEDEALLGDTSWFEDLDTDKLVETLEEKMMNIENLIIKDKDNNEQISYKIPKGTNAQIEIITNIYAIFFICFFILSPIFSIY